MFLTKYVLTVFKKEIGLDRNNTCMVISIEHEHSSVVLAGTLWMKGCDVYLANSPEECLKIIKTLIESTS